MRRLHEENFTLLQHRLGVPLPPLCFESNLETFPTDRPRPRNISEFRGASNRGSPDTAFCSPSSPHPSYSTEDPVRSEPSRRSPGEPRSAPSSSLPLAKSPSTFPSAANSTARKSSSKASTNLGDERGDPDPRADPVPDRGDPDPRGDSRYCPVGTTSSSASCQRPVAYQEPPHLEKNPPGPVCTPAHFFIIIQTYTPPTPSPTNYSE